MDTEEAYEEAPRTFQVRPVLAARVSPPPSPFSSLRQGVVPAAVTEALPVKNAAGVWEFVKQSAPAKPAAGPPAEAAAPAAARAAPKSGRARAEAALKALQVEELTLEQKRGRIADASSALLEAPERNVSELKVLQRLAADATPAVARLACLSALLVYRDLAPGYRTRLPSDKELDMAVSKEQRTLRDFETAFLKGYQAFLKLLLDAVEGRKGGGLDRRTAVRCMCGLLRALPNFNYRTDLLRALVPLMGGEDVVVAEACTEAVGSVLSDCGGEAALEAVQLLAELVKQRGCLAPEYTLEVLRSLRFSDKLATRLRDDREAGQPLSQKAKNRKWIEERRRLRDEAKLAVRKGGAPGAEQPEEQPDDRDFREFDALPDADMLLKLQTKMLEAVCEIYFRVLKAAVVPNGLHGWPLLKPTLAGLARVAFLIDYEVVNDILEVRVGWVIAGRLEAHPPLPPLRCCAS